MKTTEQIMELHDIAATELVHGHYHQLKEKRAALRTAIEELHRDAARHKFVVKSPIHAVCEWNPPRQMGCTGWYELDEEQLDAAMEAT
jgi:hypothetical protein